MLKTLKSLLGAFQLPNRSALERAYLEAAANRYDLERRERDVDAGLFRFSRFDY